MNINFEKPVDILTTLKNGNKVVTNKVVSIEHKYSWEWGCDVLLLITHKYCNSTIERKWETDIIESVDVKWGD